MSTPSITIGKHKFGPGHPVFVIAEIGTNHNGSFERAIEMIDLCVKMGADCAKFQMRNMGAVYRKKSLKRTGDDLSTEYTLDLLEKFELSIEQHQKLSDYCRSKGILYMCTPWDVNSIQVLEKIGVEAYKVASADLTNLPLIEELIKTKKPLILSTGMSVESEIQATVDFLNQRHAQFCILHCNSTYPAPFHSIHLKYMERLKEIHSIVGYSGHERGIAVTLGAVALGANVVERHFTIDRNMEGPDHAASLEPEDFGALIVGIRQLELAVGEGKVRQISQGEMMNRENLAKSLVASHPLKKGQIIRREDVSAKSPGRGISPQFLEKLVGLELSRDMEEEDYFYPTDLKGEFVQPRPYRFQRPWGIPVRYYDYDSFVSKIKPDLVEFHLSYTDLDLDLSKFFKGPQTIDFAVHAPELFAGSHLMDLATPDEEYRKRSLKETQRVIDITRQLKKYFPKTKRPLIIANVGGFSMDATLPVGEKASYYDRFLKSLGELDLEGVELIPQTMAPFPWHFGGQRYQNIFVLPDEIVEICKRSGLRMCLDVSHSKLTCNHGKKSFAEFLEKVAPFTAHLHLGDSKGLDGEGLQVDAGEINFPEMCKILHEKSPQASFIPEIWQGHKNEGEGFWIALEKLEKYGL